MNIPPKTNPRTLLLLPTQCKSSRTLPFFQSANQTPLFTLLFYSLTNLFVYIARTWTHQARKMNYLELRDYLRSLGCKVTEHGLQGRCVSIYTGRDNGNLGDGWGNKGG